MPAPQDPRLLIALGARVRVLRDASGLTQQRLAERMGIEAAALNRIERGRVGVTITTLAGLARAFGVPMGALVDLEGPQPEAGDRGGETEIVDLYRRLGEREREAVVAVARVLAKE